MTRYFAVTRQPGSAWDLNKPMRAQVQWAEHAAFMNGLVNAGFIVLGGPLGAAEAVLLIVDAKDETEIRVRLSADPWTPLRLLEIASVEPWTILLDGRDASARR